MCKSGLNLWINRLYEKEVKCALKENSNIAKKLNELFVSIVKDAGLIPDPQRPF